MTRAELIAYCLGKPGAWLDAPWEDDQVAKVGDKVFAFFGAQDDPRPRLGVKCGRSAEEARELRDRYPAAASVSPYVGRYGWNTVEISALPDDELRELVDASYDAVVAALPRSRRPAGRE